MDRIIVENDKAKGIRLKDGTEIAARKLVVGDVGTPQLFLRLIGDKYINTKMKRRIESILFDRGQVLWGTIALHELPRYRAAKSFPDLNVTPRTYWAPKDLGYYEDKYMHESYLLGMASKFFCLTCPDTIWDPTRAPEGKHTVVVEEYVCPLHFLSRREWRQLADQFVDSLLQQWHKYAPNMTKENVIASRVYTPVDVEETHPDMIEGSWLEGSLTGTHGRFRGMPGGFRTFIKNIYMCSSAVPGGPGIGRGSSYNCYRVIAEDFGLPSPQD